MSMPQFEGSLAKEKVQRDLIVFLGPAAVLSIVLLFVGPHWLRAVVGVVDGLFALMCLAATVVSVGFGRSGRRDLAARGLSVYGVGLLALVVLAVLLWTR